MHSINKKNMQTENNAGAKVIGILSLIAAIGGVYLLFKNQEQPAKKLQGLRMKKSKKH